MSDSIKVDTPETIWEGDLFGRKAEAEQLIAYVESVVGRPAIREDKKAFTIAVDAGYGEGKTFFLRRLARHIALNHPVAFVDAWADDLQDEPLTALVATLKKALDPFVKDGDVRSKLGTFLQKTGKVAKIASLGLLRRGIGYAISHEAVAGIEGVMGGATEVAKKLAADEARQASEGLVTDVVGGFKGIADNELMNARVQSFESGRTAIQEMKESLAEIVEVLDGVSVHAPIVIVIDELDRCRPTYAIKLLEEIKHLFDVPGLVFILGMNGSQLGFSINSAYGERFDGREYLRRFIDRQYELVTPSLIPLLRQLCSSYGVDESALKFPIVQDGNSGVSGFDFFRVINEYMVIYDFKARDCFQLIDMISTCIALAGGKVLEGCYLVPLIASSMLGLPRGELKLITNKSSLRLRLNNAANMREPIFLTFSEAATQIQYACSLSENNLHEIANGGNRSFAIDLVLNSRRFGTSPLPIYDLSRYPDLIAAVCRFKNPSLPI